MRAFLAAFIISGSIYLFSLPVFAAIEFSASNPNITNDTVIVDVFISGTNTPYYLQGLLRESGTTNYFGATQNHYEDWFVSDATPTKDYITTNFYLTSPVDGSWSGKVKVKNTPESPNYKGPGTYELILRRYTGNSESKSGETSPISIVFNFVTPTQTPSSSQTTPTAPPSAAKSITTTQKPTSTSTPSFQKTTTPTTTSFLDSEPSVADMDYPDLVLGESVTPSLTESTTEPEITTPKTKLLPLILVASGVLILASLAAYIGYNHYYKPKSSKIPSSD